MLLHALVYPCLEVGTLSKFTATLTSIDPTLESFHNELSATSYHFMNRKMYNVAYVFQDLLQVSCFIMLFHCFSFLSLFLHKIYISLKYFKVYLHYYKFRLLCKYFA